MFWTDFVNPSLEKFTKLHRRSERSKCSEKWKSNMFTGRSKADTLCTSNKQTSKEELKNVSKQLVINFQVAVAQATAISRAEMWEIMVALEHQAEQTWTFHQVTSLNEMNSVSGDALLRKVHRKSSSCDKNVIT